MSALSAKAIWLAPMEGVLDASMREVITRQGHYDMAVSEFIRVTDTLYPRRVFTRICPELQNGAKTKSGTPVRVQLLGQDPVAMAENAAKAVWLGSPGVDLNFGCPAPIVNRHLGGAALLDHPERLQAIVKAVREAVPAHAEVSVKMRLGYLDRRGALYNAQLIEAAGADSLAVHARSKADKYTPPAHWHELAPLQARLNIPLFANGEIWCANDWQHARKASGCDRLLLARGAVCLPNLAATIQAGAPPMPWSSVVTLLQQSHQSLPETRSRKLFPSRSKQWLNYLRRQYPQAQWVFEQVRRINDESSMIQALDTALHQTQNNL